MEKPVPSLFDMLSPRALLQMTQIDGMRTLWRALESFFHDPRLQQLFGRYATYNGSSPYHAPATLAVIAHVEQEFGVFAPRGGIYRLALALEQRAHDLGVEIACGTEIEEIALEPAGGPGRRSERAAGVRLRGGFEPADLVVANCDVAQLYERLLPRSPTAQRLRVKYPAPPPS